MANDRPVVYADPDGPGVSLTKQSFADGADINKIWAKYQNTGELPPVRPGGRYGDFSTGEDYLEATLRVQRAEEAFYALPAEVRDAVSNDPAVLLDLVYAAGAGDPVALKACADLKLIPQPEKAAEASGETAVETPAEG